MKESSSLFAVVTWKDGNTYKKVLRPFSMEKWEELLPYIWMREQKLFFACAWDWQHPKTVFLCQERNCIIILFALSKRRSTTRCNPHCSLILIANSCIQMGHHQQYQQKNQEHQQYQQEQEECQSFGSLKSEILSTLPQNTIQLKEDHRKSFSVFKTFNYSLNPVEASSASSIYYRNWRRKQVTNS